MTFDRMVSSELDKIPRELWAQRVALALRNVNEAAGNSGYNDNYYDPITTDDPIWRAAQRGLRGENV